MVDNSVLARPTLEQPIQVSALLALLERCDPASLFHLECEPSGGLGGYLVIKVPSAVDELTEVLWSTSRERARHEVLLRHPHGRCLMDDEEWERWCAQDTRTPQEIRQQVTASRVAQGLPERLPEDVLIALVRRVFGP